MCLSLRMDSWPWVVGCFLVSPTWGNFFSLSFLRIASHCGPLAALQLAIPLPQPLEHWVCAIVPGKTFKIDVKRTLWIHCHPAMSSLKLVLWLWSEMEEELQEPYPPTPGEKWLVLGKHSLWPPGACWVRGEWDRFYSDFGDLCSLCSLALGAFLHHS